MALTLVTYGGGEVLNNVFNSIAMLFNKGDGGLVHPLLLMTASIGGLVAICKAFFSNVLDNLVLKFFVPLICVFALLCVPSKTLRIEDVVRGKNYDVAHVPLFLAEFSALISSIGYQLTVAIESVMHVPDDITYNKTGMIWGADTYLDLQSYEIIDADLEQNLRRFCKQCVLYDIALGRYSIDELKKSTDLWKFLSDNTSKTRMIQYTAPGQKGAKTSCLLSCKEAMTNMKPCFESVRGFYAKQEIGKRLPLAFLALTGLNKQSEELINQQLMMSVLTDEYSGNRFAAERAVAQQRSIYNTMGTMASKSLLAMRIVLEALVYASFIFILPLTLLPHGIRYLMSWAWMAIWLQLWPPFYAILNYIMQTQAQGQFATIVDGLSDSCKGLSFFTSVGLKNLYADIFAMAGYLSMSIPFICWAILKGGVNSFVHLSGSLMAPAQAAATSAGAEQATGNYTLANTSYGNTSYQNASALQKNFAPSLTGGFLAENRGMETITYGHGETILKQGSSELRTSLFGEKGTSQTFQAMHQHAESLADTQTKGFGVSLGSHSQHLADYTGHLAHARNFGDSLSTREGSDISQSARSLEALADNLGSTYNLSRSEGMNLLMAGGSSAGAGLNLGFVRFGADLEAKLSHQSGASRDEVLNTVKSITSSDDFQSAFQGVTGTLSSGTFNSLDDEGKRLAMGISASQQDVATAQASWQSAHAVVDQLSKFKSSSESIGFSERHQLNQEFVNWAQERYASVGGIEAVNSALLKGPGSPEVASLVGGFSQFLHEKGWGWPQAKYENLQHEPNKGIGEQEKKDSLSFAEGELATRYTGRDFEQKVSLSANSMGAVENHRKEVQNEVLEKVREDKVLKPEEFETGSQAIKLGQARVVAKFNEHKSATGEEIQNVRSRYADSEAEQTTERQQQQQEPLVWRAVKQGSWKAPQSAQLPFICPESLVGVNLKPSERWRDLP